MGIGRLRNKEGETGSAGGLTNDGQRQALLTGTSRRGGGGGGWHGMAAQRTVHQQDRLGVWVWDGLQQPGRR